MLSTISHIKHPDLVAYRGLSRDYPMNTLAAIRAAANAGINQLMVDVQACSTGELVLCHELTVDINGVAQYIQYSDLTTLSDYDVGGGQRFMTLDDLFNYIDDDVNVVLRVIGRHSLHPILSFFKERKFFRKGTIWIVSGDQFLLHSLSVRLPEVKCVAILGGVPLQDLSDLPRNGIRAVMLPPQEISTELSREVRKLGLDLWAWEVDTFGLYKSCLQRSVSKIVSYHPAFLSECEQKMLSVLAD